MKYHYKSTELDKIELLYHVCCGDIEAITVTPYFYADAGTPICPECGDDLVLGGATVTTP